MIVTCNRNDCRGRFTLPANTPREPFCGQRAARVLTMVTCPHCQRVDSPWVNAVDVMPVSGVERENMKADNLTDFWAEGATRAPKPLVVTRHQGLVDWLLENGIIAKGQYQRVEHADRTNVDGRIVIGALPLHLAALAAEVWTVDLPYLTAEQRGRDLTAAEMDEAGATIARYRVQRIEP